MIVFCFVLLAVIVVTVAVLVINPAGAGDRLATRVIRPLEIALFGSYTGGQDDDDERTDRTR